MYAACSSRSLPSTLCFLFIAFGVLELLGLEQHGLLGLELQIQLVLLTLELQVRLVQLMLELQIQQILELQIRLVLLILE